MKILYTLIIVLVFFLHNKITYAANDTVYCNIDNFSITGGGTKFSFDVFLLRKSNPVFRMGNSSFMVEYNNPAALSNGTLTYINPRFTAGSPSNSYDAMTVTTYSSGRVLVQVNYNFGGIGDTISRDAGFNGLGEKIARVEMDINLAVQIRVKWDSLNTAVVNPGFLNAHSIYNQGYIGTLPVELSSFTSSVIRNNVSLKWTTSTEINNSGFQVERKSLSANSEWINAGFISGSGNSNEPKSYSFSDNALESGNYNYRLKQIDYNGNFEYFALSNEVVIGVPEKFELSQNYPNPFNPSTKINFSLPFDSKVSLNVFDMSGRLVSSLINNEFKSANYYEVEFNAGSLSSGTYFYQLKTDRNLDTKKMILIK